MIRVTVELISAIHPSRNQILGVAEISNDASGSRSRGNYRFALSRRGGKGIFRRGEVTNFPRNQRLGWDLLYLVLKAAVGGRN